MCNMKRGINGGKNALHCIYLKASLLLKLFFNFQLIFYFLLCKGEEGSSEERINMERGYHTSYYTQVANSKFIR